MKRLFFIAPFWLVLFCLSNFSVAQTVTVSVNPQMTHQYIEGFGTCIMDFGNLPPFFDDPKLYDLAVNDLGMSILRMSFPQEIEDVNDDGDPDHFNWPGFSMPYLERRMKVALEFKKRGVEKFIMSTWSPSEFIKTNRALVQGGYVRMDMYKEYAENIAACIIAAKQNWGIDIGAFAIQNELMFIEPYCSCLYTPETAREAVRALMRKFQKEGIKTRIQMPEDMMIFNRMYNYILPTMNDPETKNFTGDFCTHRQDEWGTVVKWKEAVAPYNRQTWMTETSGHAITWDGALKLANDIYDYIVGGNMSAWIYWQIADNPSSATMALMLRTEPTPKYYASKHFYRWVRPGALRIEGSSSHQNLLVSAFKHNYDGTLTLVLINKDTQDLEVRLDVTGMTQNTYEVYRSGENENCISLGKQKLTNIKIPAKHIVTLYSKDLKKTQSKKDKWPEAYTPAFRKGEKIGSFEYSNPNAQISGMMRSRRLNAIQEFFEDKDINMETGNGWTALHNAILAGREDVVRWLLSKGADPLHRAKDGWTPLHAAAATFTGAQNEDGTQKTKYDVFRLILDASRNPRVYTNEGFSPLHVAVMNEQIAWRQRAGEGIRRIGDLVIAGFSPNEPDNMGRTALHWASWQAAANQINVTDTIVSLLIRLGADVHRTDMLGRTPLHYAAEMGYVPIVRTLKQYGADPDKKDKEGISAMDLAKQRELKDVIALLSGATPVSTLSNEEQPEGSGFLGEELVRASKAGQYESVKELLMRGADATYRDSDGFNAYERARDNRDQKLMDLLKKDI